MKRLVLAPVRSLILVAALQAQAAEPPVYEDVAPIFAARCVLCHSGEAAPLGLRLDSLEGALAGSDRGPVLTAGDAINSEMLRRVKGLSQPRMPMTGPPWLTDGEIALLAAWVNGGLAAGTRQPESPAPETRASPAPGQPPNWAHVAPILAQRCAKCHAPQGLMGPAPEGYLLTSYETALAVDDRARVVPGVPEASELLRRIRGLARPRMPRDGPPWLDEDEIALIEDWISQGARDANGLPADIPAGARVRLHGSLAAGWRLDGLELLVGPATRVDKAPGPGDYVQVRGRLDARGRVVVERIRAR